MPAQQHGSRCRRLRRAVAAGAAAGVCVVTGAAAVGSLAACADAGPEVASVGPTLPRYTTRVGGPPYVQAGTVFSARLDQPLDSETTRVGTVFQATVVDPLIGSDGRALVPYGAKLTGVLVADEKASRPRVRVQLRSIDTTAGPAPLQATILSAQHIDWAGAPPPGERAPYGLLEGGWTGPPPTMFSRSIEPGYAQRSVAPREVHVPQGALLAVELVQPMVSPR
jgi:hypothetical protein